MLVELVSPEAMWAPLRHYLMLFATIAVCLLFAQAFERPLPAFRAALGRIAGRFEGGVEALDPVPDRSLIDPGLALGLGEQAHGALE